ncbi:ABC transporter substrate-binding protein [Rhodococcoides fascians]|uniref:ABC transporter substrate-binding protein n=1 Tax=Rhodococcoides fascians TaxID=1828 RepID=UPI0005663B09|nr:MULTISPECIES: ABC transporter substrate-binding protein [Rhodococcus]OZF01318.1 nitrile hydratase [Rhodococcus sp. 15-1189-1-1a]OZF15488.1 nitrile hydratase [Rhodococcus sp. 14-2686-1-2]
MAELSVTAQINVAHPPVIAYQQFLDGDILDLECTRMVVGAAVSVALPVGGGDASSAPITLLGHVASVRAGRSVAIVHHQPWRGRLTLRFHPDGPGTRLILESSLDQDGVAWLAYKRGYGPPEPLRAGRHRIGLLVSKSGSAAVFAQATETLAQLAVDDINDGGGVQGVPMELLIGDDASDSLAGAAATRRLLLSGCRVIFACVTSATFNAAAATMQGTDVLLVHTVLNEGGRPHPSIVRLGERPLAQTRVGIPALMADTHARNWFFVGHRYSWSYGAHWAARRVVAEHNGSVAGDIYLPLGTTDFAAVIAAIESTGAELILSSLVGHDEVVFEQQCFEAGLRATTRTLALVLEEATQQMIGASAADGIWAAFSYFQGTTDTHRDLESRYRALRAGPVPPISSLSETTYEAIIAYGRILAEAPDLDNLGVRQRLISQWTSPVYSTDDLSARPRDIVLAESHRGVFRPL